MKFNATSSLRNCFADDIGMNLNLVLDAEQIMLRDSVRRWASELDPRQAEPFEASWQHFTNMGLLAAGLPEHVGGFGGSAYDTMIIASELGRSLVKAPFTEVSAVSAQLLINIAPTTVQSIAEGLSRPLLAHDEEGAGGDRRWIQTSAKKHNGQWLLNGKKTGLVGCQYATSYLISAAIQKDQIKLFEVPADQAPVTHYTSIDGRSGGELQLEDTPAKLLDESESHEAALDRAIDHALVTEGAETVGAMQKALEITQGYLRERQQFGQHIGQFQALQHRIADMYIQSEQAYSILLRAVEGLRSGDSTERQRLALGSRVLISQAALFVTGQAIQLHGGIGVTEEHAIGHYFKRALAFNQRHGNANNALNRYTDLAFGTANSLAT